MYSFITLDWKSTSYVKEFTSSFTVQVTASFTMQVFHAILIRTKTLKDVTVKTCKSRKVHWQFFPKRTWISHSYSEHLMCQSILWSLGCLNCKCISSALRAQIIEKPISSSSILTEEYKGTESLSHVLWFKRFKHLLHPL